MIQRLNRREVIIRWIDVSVPIPEHFDVHRNLLSMEERERAASFRNNDDQLSYSAAHALVRGLLSERVGREPLSWKFDIGRFGKPTPVVNMNEPAVRTSISHTTGLAIAAVSVEHEIGVDAEWYGRAAPYEIIDRYFSNEERAALLKSPKHLKKENFFNIWTLKEAYSKAVGRGLNLRFSSFSIDSNQYTLLSSEEETDLSKWKFTQIDVGTEHTAALAVRCLDGNSPIVCAREASYEWLANVVQNC